MDWNLRDVTVVRDGATYTIGNHVAGHYVAVPEIGAHVIAWLRAGCSIDECADRALATTGESVDVYSFLQELQGAQVLLERRDSDPDPERKTLPWGGAGRLLFSRTAWAVYCVLSLVGAILLGTRSDLRPSATDASIGSPLQSLLVLTGLTVILTLTHEMGHVLAAAAAGVSSTLSIGRRLYFVTAQADLTRLWSLSKRNRYAPLLAGMALDAASVGFALLLQIAAPDKLGDGWQQLLRGVVLVQVSALVLQTAVFARTDLYALLLVAANCQDLWRIKTAVLRGYVKRASDEDDALLQECSQSDLNWGRVMVCMYVPGLALAAWYLVTVVVPGLSHVLVLALSQVKTHNLASAELWQGALVLLLVIAPSTVAMLSGAAAGLRALTGVPRPRARASSA